MKKIRFLSISFSLIIIVGWTILNVMVWGNNGKRGSFSSNVKEAEQRNSIIATYKGENNSETIIVERIRITIPWEYIFVSSKYYSEEFYINTNFLSENIEFILADSGTVMNGGVSAFKKLPSNLKVYFKEGKSPVNYYLEKKYPENINKIASVPFLEKIDSGPFLNDD